MVTKWKPQKVIAGSGKSFAFVKGNHRVIASYTDEIAKTKPTNKNLLGTRLIKNWNVETQKDGRIVGLSNPRSKIGALRELECTKNRIDRQIARGKY